MKRRTDSNRCSPSANNDYFHTMNEIVGSYLNIYPITM